MLPSFTEGSELSASEYTGSSSTAETPSHGKAKLRLLYVLNLLKWMYLMFPYETLVFNTPEKMIPLLISLAMITKWCLD